MRVRAKGWAPPGRVLAGERDRRARARDCRIEAAQAPAISTLTSDFAGSCVDRRAILR